LAETLLPLLDDDREKSVVIAEQALSEFSEYFGDQYMTRFREKFGLTDTKHDDTIKDGLSLIANQQVDFTLFFRHLTRTATGDDSSAVSALFPDKEAFKIWFSQWQAGVDSDKGLAAMQAANPILIPRNHRVEQAIQGAYAGDYTQFHRLTEALEKPFEEQEKYANFETPPTPEEIVHETFCGT